MKVIAITVLLSVLVGVFGHDDEKIFELLCKANSNAANAMRGCIALEPQEYQEMFSECRTKNNAVTEQALCAKWDEVYECAHENYDHTISEYAEVEKCIDDAYDDWKNGSL
ncbi:uncharacterized protein LOC106468062 [Limulus polyphemus]|uniref:Uncharacterized protein LOC106468062 n=1 Tax=Limulus polyphemus TaxID=6850 RepID=A0ABM1BKP4_LIMPO|nr:uncharacterized protein LOC106468062 [Limulus polyphemus]